MLDIQISILLFLACLSACAGLAPVLPPVSTAAVGAEATRPVSDGRIAVGDRLDIIVYTAPELSRTVEVAADGTIAIAYSGPVQALGRSPAELAAALSEAMAGQLREPRIDVLPRLERPSTPCACDGENTGAEP